MFAPSVDLRNATLSSRRAEVWVRSSQDIGGVFNCGLGHDRSAAAGWLAALTASQLRTGRKKKMDAHRAQGASRAPPGPMPSRSNPTECTVIGSPLPSALFLHAPGSAQPVCTAPPPFLRSCFFGSHRRSRRRTPSPETPRPPLQHALAALPATPHFCLPAGPPSPPTTAESARRRRLPARWPGPMSPAAASPHACSRICHIATGTPSRYCACLGRTRWARCGRVPLHAR